MTRATIDFETFSPADLRKTGAHPYAEHPGTGVYWLCYAIGDAPVQSWRPGMVDPLDLLDFVALGGTVVAHNVSFERSIWNTCLRGVKGYQWPELTTGQLDDTMARALALALPAGLGDLAAALGLRHQKDQTGHRLMMQMAKPRPASLKKGVVEYFDDDARMERLRLYCVDDVEAEREVDALLPALTPLERDIWELDQKINLRGIAIDVQAVSRAIDVVHAELETVNAELVTLTDGVVPTITNHGKLKTWLQDAGMAISSTTKNEVEETITWIDRVTAAEANGSRRPKEQFEADNEQMRLRAAAAGEVYDPPPPRVEIADLKTIRRVLDLRRTAGKASVAKLPALQAQTGSDNRARWLLMYGGASRTMRWAGRGAQPQNLPRPEFEQAEIEHALQTLLEAPSTRDALLHLSLMFGPPVSVLASCLRALFVAAPGKVLTAADLANIEGRVAAWLAGEIWKLDAFRAYDAGTGPDLYKLAYSKAFDVLIDAVTKGDRQIGKVMELFLQYEGGRGAFATGAEAYGFSIVPRGLGHQGEQVIFDEDIPELVARWRGAHPNICAFWKELNALAMHAVRNPGQVYKTRNGKISFECKRMFLLMTLPTGRALYYFRPSIEPGRFGPSLNYFGVDSKTHSWRQLDTYGGKLFENAVQAISRDGLAEGLLRTEAKGMPIVLHVHDEIVTEHAPGAFEPQDLVEAMCAFEPWAAGLPVAAEGWQATRYQK